MPTRAEIGRGRDPLALGPLHHVALVVPDLKRALSEATAIDSRWAVLDMPDAIQVRTAHGRRSVHLKVAKGQLGTTPVELIEAVDDSPWTPRALPYVHHFGYWIAPGELAERAAAYESMGLLFEATRWTESGVVEGWTYHLWPSTGLRVGLVEETEKAQREWL